MKRLVASLCTILAISLLTAPARAEDKTSARESPQESCGGLTAPWLDGARVVSLTAELRPAGALAATPQSQAVGSVQAVCDVTVVLTHPGADDRVTTRVWLPLDSWNGRFQGVGGGGYSASGGENGLAAAVRDGYSAAVTDAGVSTNGADPSSWALDERGRVDTGLLENFAGRSLHEMALVGKQVTAAFYGRQTFYSYWNGCSTGGRQGLMMAQRYPEDFNGIAATAPAANWDRFIPGESWPQVVMNQERNTVGPCELNAFTQAAITTCDRDDGVADGVVDEPDRCRFDPRTLIGKRVVCNGTTVRISAADARVVALIWAGPTTRTGQFLWYGLGKTAPMTSLAATTTGPEGRLVGAPFPISDAWIKYFLKRDPDFDASNLTYMGYENLFRRSQREYNDIIGTDDPDLRAFDAAGGKMITWHGLSDQLITAQGTVDYRKRVERAMGGARHVDSFFRVFLAPGVDHCAGGNGPVPTDPMKALVNWVERGDAPETLAASTTSDGSVVTRDLCRYPLHSRFTGHGSTTSADNYTCRR